MSAPGDIGAAAAVTAIVPDAKPGAVKIKVGRRVVGRIGERDVVEIGIRIGTAWTEALAARVAEAGECERARAVARRLVNARPRSRAELLEALRGKGLEESTAVRVVAEFERAGIVDEARLAASVVDSVRSRRPAGRALIERKLASRGVDASAAAQAVDAALDGVNAYAEARGLAAQQLRKMPGKLDQAARARRLYGLLARRGFDADVCERVVGELVAGRE